MSTPDDRARILPGRHPPRRRRRKLRSVAEAAYAAGLELDASPLESNESDWQEQRQIVEDPDEDEIR